MKSTMIQKVKEIKHKTYLFFVYSDISWLYRETCKTR